MSEIFIVLDIIILRKVYTFLILFQCLYTIDFRSPKQYFSLKRFRVYENVLTIEYLIHYHYIIYIILQRWPSTLIANAVSTERLNNVNIVF